MVLLMILDRRYGYKVVEISNQGHTFVTVRVHTKQNRLWKLVQVLHQDIGANLAHSFRRNAVDMHPLKSIPT